MVSKEIYERSLAQGFGIPNMKTNVDKEAPLKTKDRLRDWNGV